MTTDYHGADRLLHPLRSFLVLLARCPASSSMGTRQSCARQSGESSLQCDNHAVTRPLVPENIYGEYRSPTCFTRPGRPETWNWSRPHIRPGEKVAIRPSWCRKDDALPLLAGLSPASGRVVKLDGLDIIQQIARAHLPSEHLQASCPQGCQTCRHVLRDNLLAASSGTASHKSFSRACQVTGLGVFDCAPEGTRPQHRRRRWWEFPRGKNSSLC